MVCITLVSQPFPLKDGIGPAPHLQRGHRGSLMPHTRLEMAVAEEKVSPWMLEAAAPEPSTQSLPQRPSKGQGPGQPRVGLRHGLRSPLGAPEFSTCLTSHRSSPPLTIPAHPPNEGWLPSSFRPVLRPFSFLEGSSASLGASWGPRAHPNKQAHLQHSCGSVGLSLPPLHPRLNPPVPIIQQMLSKELSSKRTNTRISAFRSPWLHFPKSSIWGAE